MSELDDLKAEMDAANLYTETIVTDRKMGAMRVLKPITADGEPDLTRKSLFMGEVQIMTQMGPLPISFEIEADTMAEAVAKYGESAKLGVQKTIEQLQQMRRDAASKIVTPGSPGFGVPGMGGTGGKIQMP